MAKAAVRAAPAPLGVRRLAAQRLSRGFGDSAAEVVASLGAVQAQDYAATKLAVGLRLSGGSDAGLEEALSAGSVLRTHAMRCTWQLLAREDVRWILDLVRPRVLDAYRGRLRQLGVDAAAARRSLKVFARVLAGGVQLTRDELADAHTAAGISTEGQIMPHLLGHAEAEGLICSGARRGKQVTWALLDERVPPQAPRPRDEAVAELARRYFTTRGPATLSDFTWWSGLTQAEAKPGIAAAGAALQREEVDGAVYWAAAGAAPRAAGAGRVHLLPAFDEYLVAYKNRDAVLDPALVAQINAGGGLLNPCVVVDGRVVGTWRRELSKDAVEVTVQPFAGHAQPAAAALQAAVDRYGTFLGREARLKGAAQRKR